MLDLLESIETKDDLGIRNKAMLELMYDLTDQQQQLINLLRDSEDGMHINQLVMETRLAYNMVSSELVMLELQDLVKSMPGGMWRMKK